MSSYRGTADRPQQIKAAIAVVAVHVLLAAVIIAGLKVGVVKRAAEQLITLEIKETPPPPPAPPPAAKPQPAKKRAGAPAPKAEPTAVVAPEPKLPLLSPVPAAKVAGSASASASGASTAGSGTGAGGAGNGTGGDGSDYSRFTPARLVRNLSRGDYRSLTAGRLPSGRAMVSLRVEPSGLPSNCRVTRSSGDPVVDAGLCPLIEARLRFRPALDDRGQPIAYRLDYVATWSF